MNNGEKIIPYDFHMRRDSTDGKAAAFDPEEPGSNPVVGMKK